MRLLRRIQYVFHRDRRERELAEELAFHRALAEQEQREAGLAAQAARRAASLRMGNETLAREAAHHVWLPGAIEGFGQDVRYAWRGLWRTKTLLAVACLSLALSTGFGAAIFSVVNSVVFQPVTAARPEALLRLWVGNSNRISWPNLRELCEETQGVACAGYRTEEFAWNEGGEPAPLFAQAVSPRYFSMLGVQAAIGRVFTPETIREQREAVVVTHVFWQRRLGGDPNVLGRTLLLAGHPYMVIGVLPRGFRSIWGLGLAPSVYLPAGSAARPFTNSRGQTEYEILAAVAPGQSLGEFRSRVLAKVRGMAAAYPVENREFGRVQTFPMRRLGLFLSQKDSKSAVLVVFTSALLVLVLLLALVGCVNVAGLLAARAVARRREIAVRLSIGCGRMRLARMLLAESFLLAIAGVGVGALLSLGIARFLVAMPLPLPVPFEAEIALDLRLLGYLAALVSLVTIVAGVAPILQAWRVPAAGGATGGPRALGFRRWSVRGVLIAAQVMVSVILLVATALFVRSLWAASRIDPGFDLDRVVTVALDTQSQQLSEPDVAAFQQAALARLKELGGTTAVSAARLVPLSLDAIVNSAAVDRGGREQYVRVYTNWVLPDYFRLMGIPLRAGREFAETDRQAKPLAVIVNETLARRLFPGRSALGQRIRRPSEKPEPWAEIVGIAADSRYMTLGEETQPQVYWPFGPGAMGGAILHVRTEGDPAALARRIPAILRQVDPRVAARARPLRSIMTTALFPAQAAAAALSALGLVGWVLTVAGLYGVVSYTVAQRTQEIGLRLALGATPSAVIGLLLRDGLAITGAGLGVGLVLAAVATPALAMLLAGVPPHDPASFGLVAAVFVATALAASYGPARRGARLQPMDALRNE